MHKLIDSYGFGIRVYVATIPHSLVMKEFSEKPKISHSVPAKDPDVSQAPVKWKVIDWLTAWMFVCECE